MGEHIKVFIGNEDSSPHSAACAMISLYKIPSMLHNIMCSSAFLLTLCLATSTMAMFLDTPILFRCLAFLPHVGFAFVFSRLIVTALIFYIERYFVMNTNKALYFVFALKRSVQYFFCSSLILLSAWFLFTKPTEMSSFLIINLLITSTLATCVIASAMSMLKIAILRALDCRFHDKNFLNMQDAISQEYVLQTLLESSRGSNYSYNDSAIRAKLEWIKATLAKMLLLGNARFHTICDALEKSDFIDEHSVEGDVALIFKNLKNNDEPRDIYETDLLGVMKKEDLAYVLQLFEGAVKTKRISEASLRKWMVKVHTERKLVVHSLNNTSNVIEQLNIIVSVNLSFLVALVWCLLMGFGTTKFLVFISSHLLLLVYFFGDYCKMICEGILFAIVMHPFDVGDHCIIDNELQLMVEEIGIMNTVFLKDNNEKVNCLNSVLLTKSISNLSRSSKLMDTFEILVGGATSFDTIAALKIKIDELLGSNPESWRADHCFDLKGTDNDTHKYNLQISYATHFQNYEEMNYRRSELVLKLRRVLEELDIKNFTIQ